MKEKTLKLTYVHKLILTCEKFILLFL